MKYLKSFNENIIPLSKEEKDEIIEYCKDILINLKDDEFRVSISIDLDNRLIITIERNKDFNIGSFKDELRMISSYLRSLGFIFDYQRKKRPNNDRYSWQYSHFYKFEFGYRKDDNLNESIHDLEIADYDEDDEELLEIKDAFMDIMVDEFELEKYTQQENDGIYYEIERSYSEEEDINIYIWLVDSGDEDSIEFKRFIQMHKHLDNLKERLNAMGYDCNYHKDIAECGEDIAEQGYTMIWISKYSNLNESNDFNIEDIMKGLPKSNRYKTLKGEISLLEPSPFTMNFYEIYCIEGNFFDDVERYETLKEAEERIDELIDWFN